MRLWFMSTSYSGQLAALYRTWVETDYFDMQDAKQGISSIGIAGSGPGAAICAKPAAAQRMKHSGSRRYELCFSFARASIIRLEKSTDTARRSA